MICSQRHRNGKPASQAAGRPAGRHCRKHECIPAPGGSALRVGIRLDLNNESDCSSAKTASSSNIRRKGRSGVQPPICNAELIVRFARRLPNWILFARANASLIAIDAGRTHSSGGDNKPKMEWSLPDFSMCRARRFGHSDVVFVWQQSKQLPVWLEFGRATRADCLPCPQKTFNEFLGNNNRCHPRKRGWRRFPSHPATV